MKNNYYHFPMSVLTEEVGSKRKLISRPHEIIKRGFINSDLSLSDPTKIKIPPGKYAVEVKEQGHHYILFRDKDGYYHWYTKNTNKDGEYVDQANKLEFNFVKPETLPLNTVLQGELMYPGEPDSYVPTAIKDESCGLVFVPFCCPIHKGQLTYFFDYAYSRQILMSLLKNQHYDYNIISNSFMVVDITEENKEEVVCSLLTKIRDMGVEGFVLKDINFTYGSKRWWKIKCINERDVFVIGHKISESETKKGLVTSLEMGVINENGDIISIGYAGNLGSEEEATLSGESDKNIKNIKNREESHSVFRVIYQERFANGCLKHASFDGWREDKDWGDCLF